MKNTKTARLDFLRWFIKGYAYKYFKKYTNYELTYKIILSFKLFKKMRQVTRDHEGRPESPQSKVNTNKIVEIAFF